jgi:transcriptional regulator with XRE-family HTH domain
MIMGAFSNRLKELRGAMTLDELSDNIGINQSTLSRYETSGRHPKADNLERIADFFNVSTDYMLGKTNFKEIEPSFNPLKLKEIRGNRTYKEFSNIVIGITGGIPLYPDIIKLYEKGIAEPSRFILEQIAKAENINVNEFYINDTRKSKKYFKKDKEIDISFMDKEIQDWIIDKKNYSYIKLVYRAYLEKMKNVTNDKFL